MYTKNKGISYSNFLEGAKKKTHCRTAPATPGLLIILALATLTHLYGVRPLCVCHFGGEYLAVAEEGLLSNRQGQLVKTFGEFGRQSVLAGQAHLLVDEVDIQGH